MTQPTIAQEGGASARPPAEEPHPAEDAAGPPDIRGNLGEWVGETVTIHQHDWRPIVGRLMEVHPEYLVLQEFLRKNRYSPIQLSILKSMGADREMVSFYLEDVLRITPGDIYARFA